MNTTSRENGEGSVRGQAKQTPLVVTKTIAHILSRFAPKIKGGNHHGA